MTPLELLAVGVAVVLVWLAGFAASTETHRGNYHVSLAVPPLLGLVWIVIGLVQLIWLGIKEAAK